MYMHSFQRVSVASSNNNNKNIHLCCHNVHIWNFGTMWTTHAITIDTHIQWCNSEPIRQQTHSAISMHNRYIHNISIYLFVSSNFLFPSFRSFYLIRFEYIYSYVCVCVCVFTFLGRISSDIWADFGFYNNQTAHTRTYTSVDFIDMHALVL